MEHSGLELNAAAFPATFFSNLAQHSRQMSSAIWLYLLLRALAEPRTGRVSLTVEQLAAAADAKEETVLSQVGRLRAKGYLQTHRQGNALQLHLAQWEAPQVDRPEAGEAPSPDPVAGALAKRIADRLEDMGRLAHYEDLVEQSTDNAARALREALAIPAESIRKSRAALFDYLFNKYAQEGQE
tara:strand:+ start:6966 stop:7517 length:552 start_codon:yes stop_codon:yes gene_type:complete